MNLNIPGIRIDEWRGLDPKEPWTWPQAPKTAFLLGIAILVVVAGYFLVIAGKQEDLDAAVEKQQSLMTEYKTKYEQGINLAAYKEQRMLVEKSFGELLRQLPSKAEMEALLTDVNQAGTGRGLVFELFKPAAKETLYDFYAEQPIAVKLTGTYHDFGDFASAIAHMDRIVTINDVALNGNPGSPKIVMEATATTFRYLDPKEVQAQKKLAVAASAAKKGEEK